MIMLFHLAIIVIVRVHIHSTWILEYDVPVAVRIPPHFVDYSGTHVSLATLATGVDRHNHTHDTRTMWCLSKCVRPAPLLRRWGVPFMHVRTFSYGIFREWHTHYAYNAYYMSLWHHNRRKNHRVKILCPHTLTLTWHTHYTWITIPKIVVHYSIFSVWHFAGAHQHDNKQ